MVEVFRLSERAGFAAAAVGVLEAVLVGFDGGGAEGTEVEEAADEGPEVGHVDDDGGGGGLAGVPVEVGEVAEAAGEVVVAV